MASAAISRSKIPQNPHKFGRPAPGNGVLRRPPRVLLRRLQLV